MSPALKEHIVAMKLKELQKEEEFIIKLEKMRQAADKDETRRSRWRRRHKLM
ncbi:hypothetical protein L13192_02468 [Pyrenophora tritici-repentis]|uniref:Uncharacterized protein n=1 Tax=Pyrenophora tritici-repentis TaxID=45151 RepID=A0A922T3V2_9PLEO|nr:hypothetical protein Ptr86124_000266 [Pyrenophora tritici-repentis]KAI1675721.1 hypothetical protein L13192_02468 [Pyrenophora tritici-repentis]KAI1687115.1 hypothetical protein KJE20_00292 [Pyrenophora tritici-repentis]